MNTTATAVDLGSYDGIDLLGSTVSIRNAGDGLSDSLAVEPAKLPIHSTVHVVLECEVTKHTYEEIKDVDGLRVVNVLKAGRATMVDADLVREHLDEQQRRIDEAEGQLTLETTEGFESSEPQSVGEALDSVDLLKEVEVDDLWRKRRRSELERLTKDEVSDRAFELEVATGDLTKLELIEAVIDAEAESGEQLADVEGENQ